MIMKTHVSYNRYGDHMKIKRFSLGEYQSNCYIVYENNHALVIDPGYESQDVIDFIDEHQLKIDMIYITHGHFDHIGGVNQLKKRYQPLVYAPIKDKIWMEKGPYYRFDDDLLVDVWITEQDQLSFLDYKIKIYETPGHSKGSTVLLIDGILFSGDTLFFQSIGRTDIPFADQMEIYQSIKKLYQIFKDDTICYPGHGRHTTIGHEKKYNPFVRG